MSDLQELIEELMQDSKFRKEYEALQPETNRIRAYFNAKLQAVHAQNSPFKDAEITAE